MIKFIPSATHVRGAYLTWEEWPVNVHVGFETGRYIERCYNTLLIPGMTYIQLTQLKELLEYVEKHRG